MRTIIRSRARDDRDEQPPQQHEKTRERDQQREKGAEQTRDVRIPKIQYRFIKELEERGPSANDAQGAREMADKIKRFPIGPQAVMQSWERFTKEAIEEYKAGTGDGAVRDQKHRDYALFFMALQGRGATDRDELKRHVENAIAKLKNRAQGGASVTDKLPSRAPQKQPEMSAVAAKGQEKEKEKEAQGRQPAGPPTPTRPTQRVLALPEQTFGEARYGASRMFASVELPHSATSYRWPKDPLSSTSTMTVAVSPSASVRATTPSPSNPARSANSDVSPLPTSIDPSSRSLVIRSTCIGDRAATGSLDSNAFASVLESRLERYAQPSPSWSTSSISRSDSSTLTKPSETADEHSGARLRRSFCPRRARLFRSKATRFALSSSSRVASSISGTSSHSFPRAGAPRGCESRTSSPLKRT